MAREERQAMSAARLAVLKARMEAIPGSVFVTTQKELSQTFFDRNELVNAMEYALSEVERLRAREAALVAVVRAVADSDVVLVVGSYSVNYLSPLDNGEAIKAEVFREQARALLASADEQGEA